MMMEADDDVYDDDQEEEEDLDAEIRSLGTLIENGIGKRFDAARPRDDVGGGATTTTTTTPR